MARSSMTRVSRGRRLRGTRLAAGPVDDTIDRATNRLVAAVETWFARYASRDLLPMVREELNDWLATDGMVFLREHAIPLLREEGIPIMEEWLDTQGRVLLDEVVANARQQLIETIPDVLAQVTPERVSAAIPGKYKAVAVVVAVSAVASGAFAFLAWRAARKRA